MWMMGYNEGDFNLPDSFTGRKLRPLIPRGPLPLSAPNHNTAASPPCLNRSRHHGASHDFIAHYHQLAAMAEQSKRSEYMTPQVVVSSRWNPTAEQLRALEELYSRGTRTPSAEQIQQITAQLRRYGKIEGKNVFYWFQNHKARERQKRRRQMESTAPSPDDHNNHTLQMSVTSADDHDHQKKESLGSRRTSVEVEETNNNNNNNNNNINNNNWPTSSNSTATTIFPQESVGIESRAGKAGRGLATAECSRKDGWIQFEEEQMQQRRNFVERNATWQMMQLSCPLQPHHPAAVAAAPLTHLINYTPHSTTCTATTTQAIRSRGGAILDQRLIKSPTDHHLNFFIAPYTSSETIFTGLHRNSNNNNLLHHHQDHHHHRGGDESETLQLFPLRSGVDHVSANANANEDVLAHDPYPFFEFLPLKN